MNGIERMKMKASFYVLTVGCAVLHSCLVVAQGTPATDSILDTEKTRGSSEPTYVLTGGPSAEDVKRNLEQRIKEQSQGRIQLFGFRQKVVKAINLELSDRTVVAFEFEAGIEFDQPCKWATRYKGRPLTFIVLDPLTDTSGTEGLNKFGRGVVEVGTKGERFVISGYTLHVRSPEGWSQVGIGQSGLPLKKAHVPSVSSAQCVNQLKQVGLAFRIWALDNGDHYPFNVSTNTGGTLELCRRATDGFDQNTVFHFLVMSNELGTPKFLVCPGDSVKQPAAVFTSLQASNVSYRIRSERMVDETNPEEVLGVCPIHGHILRADGTVTEGTNN